MQFEKLSKGKQRSRHSLEERAECKMRMGQVDAADDIYCQIYNSKSWMRFEKRTDLYSRSGNEKKTRELLDMWRKELKLEKNDPISRCFRRVNDNEFKKYYKEYFIQAAWTEMMFGTKEAALKNFEDMLLFNTDQSEEHNLLCNIVVGCIICGDDKRGKKYSARLQKWYNKESFKRVDRYYNSAKGKLNAKILSVFYTVPPEKIQELLDQERVTEICHFCTNPYCKELEGLRVMFLLRQGRRQEAWERLTLNLEKYPQDEYMLAVKHTAFGDSPESVRD